MDTQQRTPKRVSLRREHLQPFIRSRDRRHCGRNPLHYTKYFLLVFYDLLIWTLSETPYGLVPSSIPLFSSWLLLATQPVTLSPRPIGSLSLRGSRLLALWLRLSCLCFRVTGRACCYTALRQWPCCENRLGCYHRFLTLTVTVTTIVVICAPVLGRGMCPSCPQTVSPFASSHLPGRHGPLPAI